MPADILNGKLVANQLNQQTKSAIDQRLANGQAAPQLCVIIVGENPASLHYISHKVKACNKVGVQSKIIQLPTDSHFNDIQKTIIDCADDSSINGILLQLPLPDRTMEEDLIECIPTDKDVDGFHPFNIGRLALNMPSLRSCTPYGIIQLLEHYQIPLQGKHCVIVGASNIVGRPMMLECLNQNMTVTICHIHTQDLKAEVERADVCIVAVGKRNVIEAEWLKPGVIVIDVGFEKDADGNIYGDVPYKQAKEIASYITPVPGGVGPMTVATLMHNTLQATELQDARQLMG